MGDTIHPITFVKIRGWKIKTEDRHEKDTVLIIPEGEARYKNMKYLKMKIREFSQSGLKEIKPQNQEAL